MNCPHCNATNRGQARANFEEIGDERGPDGLVRYCYRCKVCGGKWWGEWLYTVRSASPTGRKIIDRGQFTLDTRPRM